MRLTFSLVIYYIMAFTSYSYAADIYKCGDVKGFVMWSMENHKHEPDGYKNVNPVFVIENENMTIVWGDSKSAGGAEKSWKAIIIHNDDDMVSGVALDAGEAGSAAMLYSLDKKRGYVYLSTHKNSIILDGTSAG